MAAIDPTSDPLASSQATCTSPTSLSHTESGGALSSESGGALSSLHAELLERCSLLAPVGYCFDERLLEWHAPLPGARRGSNRLHQPPSASATSRAHAAPWALTGR